MNKEKVNEFNAYLDNQITACRQREEEMRKDDRADERIFEKIRGNVYDIFKTVFSVAVKNAGNEAAVQEFFSQKLDQLPVGWQVALEKATAHGDTEKAQIESIKLGTAEEIRKVFLNLCSNV